MIYRVDNFCGGFYEVGSKYFVNKILACIEATNTKNEVWWRYFDHVWMKAFRIRPSSLLDLRLLFRNNALRLRDKYDYLVLSYSGGSDSWTILNTFLKNEIFLDEIVVNWPLRATKGINAIHPYTPNRKDISSGNTLSEWDFFLEEDLKSIKKISPNTIITIQDWSTSLIENTPETELFARNQNFLINLPQIKSIGIRTEKERIASEKGLETAYILGIDKPGIRKVGSVCYLSFDDRHLRLNINKAVYGSNIEYFYWTPEMPEIATTQAWAVFDSFKNGIYPTNILDNLHNSATWKQYIRIVKEICRPDYDLHRFQATFTESVLHGERVEWCRSIPIYRSAFDRWDNIVESQFKLIDSRFLNIGSDGVYHGIKSMNTMYHKIGEINE
jgi:hypothetical protein